MENTLQSALASAFIEFSAKGATFEDFLVMVHRRVASESDLEEIIDLVAAEAASPDSAEAVTARRLASARTAGIVRTPGSRPS